MAEVVKLVDPHRIGRNPENPRLIFHQEELTALEESIAKQGILVPLTIFQDGKDYYLLDGERRWRCAIKLGISRVPVIVQPKPERMQNIMMMFAIHNARKDWDPLPTALKLDELEKEYTKRNGKKPTERELAGIASLSRGEIRRLKKLLRLPRELREELMHELKKPRSKQQITVDHVLESTKAAEALKKRSIIGEDVESSLTKAIIAKFRTGVINNTVAPRKLVKLAQAVQRGEVAVAAATLAVEKLIQRPDYSIDSAFAETVEQVDFQHTFEQLVERLMSRIEEHQRRRYKISDKLKEALRQLIRKLEAFL